MSVVLQPSVTMEKLRELLAEQAESEPLDYKAACDLGQSQDVVELAQDVGAMQIDEGFIVIGSDEQNALLGT